MGAFWEKHFQIILVFWAVAVGISLGLKFGGTVFELFVLFCTSLFAVFMGIHVLALFEGLKTTWLDIEPEEVTKLKEQMHGRKVEPERNLFLNLLAKWWALFYFPGWFFLATRITTTSLDGSINRVIIVVIAGMFMFAVIRTLLLLFFRTYGSFVPKVLT